MRAGSGRQPWLRIDGDILACTDLHGFQSMKLARLEPELVVTGHGRAMQGPEMRSALHILATNFDHIAVPHQGRYVNHPARADASGVTFIPPKAE